MVSELPQKLGKKKETRNLANLLGDLKINK